MAEVIRMPRMSDTMTEGVIVEWHKKIGDKVKPGDILAEVETDKATMELDNYLDGVLLYIGVEKGKAVAVDGVLAVVGKEGEEYQTALDGAGSPAAKNEAPQPSTPDESSKPAKQGATNENKQAGEAPKESQGATLPEGAKVIRMPLLSDTMTEGKIIQWNKKLGDKVKSDDAIAEVETDKATMEVVGYEEGELLYIGVEAGNAAKVNEIIAIVGKPGTDVSAYVAAEKSGGNAGNSQQTADKENNTAPSPAKEGQKNDKDEEMVTSPNSNGRVIASPLAKRLAAEKGIDISRVNGSGDGGRIIKKDVDNFIPEKATDPKQTSETKGDSPKVAEFIPGGTEGHTDLPNTQMRKVIAKRLGESKFSAPHFYLTMEINMDNAISSRTAMNELSPAKISFNDLVIKACAMALRQHPAVNSSWMGDFIRQNQHIHIGSAVAMPEGLIVPVIRFADQKTLSQIAGDAKDLYAKAKNKKLQPAEFSGNTFTVSNLGMMDVEEFTAIINPPDSAILAVGRIKEIVVKKGEGFGTTSVMKVTLSCDHRSVDGAVGAAFLQTVKKFLENPVTMLI